MRQHFSGCAELTPLGQGGSATVLEGCPADEVTVLIEVIVGRAVQGSECLQTSHSPELKHCPLPSSERLVTVLSPVVQPAARGHEVQRRFLEKSRHEEVVDQTRLADPDQRAYELDQDKRS